MKGNLDRQTMYALMQVAQVTMQQHVDGLGLGVEVSIRNGKYDNYNCAGSITIELASVIDGTPMTTDAVKLCDYAEYLGLPPDVLGKEFTTSSGKTYKLTGYRPRNRTYPFLAVDTKTGKKMKLSEDLVLNYLG